MPVQFISDRYYCYLALNLRMYRTEKRLIMKLKQGILSAMVVTMAVVFVAPGCDKKKDDAKPKDTTQSNPDAGKNNPSTPSAQPTPEQIQEVVNKVEKRITGDDGIAVGLHTEMVKSSFDKEKVKSMLTELRGLKRELEVIPAGTPELEKPMKKVVTLIDAAETTLDLEKADAKLKPLKSQADINQDVAKKKETYEMVPAGGKSASEYIAELKEDDFSEVEKKVIRKIKPLAEKLQSPPDIHQGVDVAGVLKYEGTIKDLVRLKNDVVELLKELPKKAYDLNIDQIQKQLDYVESMEVALERAKYNEEAADSLSNKEKLQKEKDRLQGLVKEMIK